MVKSRHMGLSLVSWGPSVDFNMVVMDCTWANTMLQRTAISRVSIFSAHGMYRWDPLPSETYPKAGKNIAGPWRASLCVLTSEIIKKLVLIKKFQNKASDFPSPKV